MTVYTVHAPPEPSGSVVKTAEKFVFIKESFAIWAFITPPLWLIYHRMWLVLAGWLVFAAAVAAGHYYVGGLIPGIVDVVASLWFALEANELRRWTLARNGWQFLGVAAGRRRDEIERNFFAGWTGELPDRFHLAPSTQRALAPRDVVGVFPVPGGHVR